MARIDGRGGIVRGETPLQGAACEAHDEAAETPLAAGPAPDPTGATEIENNVFVGTEEDDNDVFGEETDDTVRGLGGDDYIWGGAGGIDRLEGGTGGDYINV